jgi:NAD(P)-dependent dehydrogenase (short-subunit alcohol dehydrogenase family)
MSKIAIVTGASSGIGYAAALSLAERGVDCIATFNRNEDGVRSLIEAFEQRGRKAIAVRLDVGRLETFPMFGQEVVAALRTLGTERFDYLVNNAGFGGMSMFEDTTPAQFEDFMQALLQGPYFLTQALLPWMNDGGAIVNVTSNATGLGLEPGYSAYASMKGGLTILTRCLAKELSPRRIRANSVAPGPTHTRIGDGAFDKYPEFIPTYVERTALGRMGEPDDVGAVVAALLSDDFRWVTGQEIEVSGGYRL